MQTDLWGHVVADGAYVAEALKATEKTAVSTGASAERAERAELARRRARERRVERRTAGNPCLALFGPGPEGVRCGTCAHLRRERQAAVWNKCDLRANTHGAATDHRVRWPACGRYVERVGEVRE